MSRLTISLVTVAAAIAASVALADPAGPGYGPGYGPGAGAGCVNAGSPGAGCADTGTPGAGCGYGPGMGRGMGRGGGQGYGAQLLTPDERAVHMETMHSFTTVEQCNAYLAEHRQLIAERAQAQGLAVPPQRGNPCERMKARGFLS